MPVPTTAIRTVQTRSRSKTLLATAPVSISATAPLALCATALILMLFSTGCTEYWWQRGQPPGTRTLLDRSQAALDDSLKSFSSKRPEVAKIATEINTALDAAVKEADKGAAGRGPLLQQLITTRSSMMSLEGLTSIGSRAAQAELNGELRMFIDSLEKGATADRGAVTLFASRTVRFLANELSVPAPVTGS